MNGPSRRILGVLILATSISPTATSSGSLDAGPLVVVFDNGHESDCFEELTQLCLASATGETMGNTEVDARQNFHYLGAGVNDSFREKVNDEFGIPLVPDGSLVHVDARTLHVPNPAFRILAENVGEQTGPASAFMIYFTTEHWGIRYLAPDPNSPGMIVEHEWENKFYENGTEYEGWDDLYDQGENSVDNQVYNTLIFPCFPAEEDTCFEQQAETADVANATIPNVVYGSAIEVVEAAGSADALHGNVAIGERSTASSPLGARGTAALPPGQLERAPLPPAALPRGASAPTHSAQGGLPLAPTEPGKLLPHLTTQQVDKDSPPRYVRVIVVATLTAALAITFAVLYSRIRGSEDKLLSPSRTRILDELSRRGPLNYSELARISALDRKTIEHHARILAREGRVTLKPDAKQVYVILAGQAAPPPQLKSARSAACRAIIDALNSAGGAIERRDVERYLPDLPQRTRNHALRVLESEGLVEQVWQPKGLLVRLRSISGDETPTSVA